MEIPKLLQPKDTYTIDYPEAIEFSRQQASILWTPDEIDVDKDLHSIKTEFNEAEYHGVVTTLKLFTLYELKVGQDYWSGYVGRVFKRPDIQRMAATFSFVELGVHAPFYNKINEVLGLDTDSFYSSYLDDNILKDRMDWIDKRVSKRGSVSDILKSIGIFSMIEGAILYSSFAFLKHFNNNGSNKLTAVNAGINYSVIDELIHSKAGAWLFRTLLNEYAEADINLNIDGVNRSLYETANIIYEHESQLIDKIFEKGSMEGITSSQIKIFIQSRLDDCLINLGLMPMYSPKYNPIAEWFYKDIKGSTLHDFFVSHGSSYNRDWDKRKFTWRLDAS
jgi:ribonucleotide reductase beta subunit family protein with ferritin-like domain